MISPQISPLTLGTAQIGGRYGIVNDTGCPEDKEVLAIFDVAEAAGIAYFDTAAAYGDAEKRLGRLLPVGRRRRWGKITKVPSLEGRADEKLAFVTAVRRSVQESRRRLRTARLDIVMFHRAADAFRYARSGLDVLQVEVDRGLVGEIGVSIYSPEEAISCLADPRIRHIQLPFNILDWRWVRPPFCEAIGDHPEVRVHARSAFLQGLLLNPTERWPAWVEGSERLQNRIDQCVLDLGCRDRIDLCLSFNHSMGWITTTVIGVETSAQLELLTASFSERRFDEDEIAMVSALARLAPERLLNPSKW
ncbi:MAG: aldo/keto reductase [Sphingomicrobium sp.]